MDSRKESPLVILTRALPPAVVGIMIAQVAIVVGGLLIGAIALGSFLDTRAATRPLFTLLLVCASLPISVFLTYRLALRTSAKAHQAYEAYLQSKRTNS